MKLIKIIAIAALSVISSQAFPQQQQQETRTLTLTTQEIDAIGRLIQVEMIRRQTPYVEMSPLLQKIIDQANAASQPQAAPTEAVKK